MSKEVIPIDLKTVSLFDSVHDFGNIATDSTMLIRDIKDEWQQQGKEYSDKFYNYLLKFLFTILAVFGFNQDLSLIQN